MQSIIDPDEVLADSVSALSSGIGAEGKLERPLERFYSLIFILSATAVFFYLASRAVTLQVFSGGDFYEKSQENRFAVRPVFASRGVVFDRWGRPLVENIPIFGLIFEKEKFLAENGDLRRLLDELSIFLEKPREALFDLGFPDDYDIAKVSRRLVLAEGLAPEEVVVLATRSDKLPGVKIFESYRRVYSDPYANSHVLGFVGKITAEDIARSPEFDYGATIGKSGIEAFYDESLRGRGGKKIVEVDSLGRETRFKLSDEPQAGSQLFISLDGELERSIYDLVAAYTGARKGASVVALDPKSGEILALVSFPGFDINRFGFSLTQQEFDSVLKDLLKPFFNRAISGEFPSGSVIKPVIAAAALEEGIIDPQKRIFDEGFIEIQNPYRPGEVSRFLDWRAHGWINFYDAIAISANVYFYTIGGGYRDQPGLGIERIKKYANAFGLGSRLGIDLPGEKPGSIPDPELKKKTEPQDPVWRVGDTYNVSIGQGGVEVTPLQMASLTAAIANGGKLYRPYLLREIRDQSDMVTYTSSPEVLRENMVSQENLREVRKGMRQTVLGGTAKLLGSLPVAVAAKTGTAQVGPNRLPHAWVTAFAPAEDPQIALAVMVENAGEGSTVAVPITHDILQWYFEHR